MAIIPEPAVQQAAQDTAVAQENNEPAGTDSNVSPAACNGTEGARRGSAEAFRALAAKLRSSKAQAPVAQQPQAPSEPEVAAVADQPAQETGILQIEYQPPQAEEAIAGDPQPHIETAPIDYLAPQAEAPRAEFAVPQVDPQQDEYLAPQTEPVQSEFVAPPVDQPQAEYLVSESEQPPADVQQLPVEAAETDYLAPQPADPSPSDIEDAVNYTVSSPAGDPGTLDEHLTKDLPILSEPPEEFAGLGDLSLPDIPLPVPGELDAGSTAAPAPVIEEAPRQVYQGPASFDDDAVPAVADAVDLPAVSEFVAAEPHQTVSDSLPAFEPPARTEFEPVAPPEIADQPAAVAFGQRDDVPGVAEDVQPQEYPVEELQPVIQDTAEQVDLPAQSEITPEPEPDVEPVVSDAPEEAPQEVSEIAAEDEAPVMVAEDQALFNSALDEFKESNLSVEQLLAEITGVPAAAEIPEESAVVKPTEAEETAESTLR